MLLSIITENTTFEFRAAIFEAFLIRYPDDQHWKKKQLKALNFIPWTKNLINILPFVIAWVFSMVPARSDVSQCPPRHEKKSIILLLVQAD